MDMICCNHESEMLSEIAFARLVKLIVMETCSGKPSPASESYLSRKGFDFGIQNLGETINELSHFVEIIDVTETVEVLLPREEKSREEKSRKDICTLPQTRTVGFKKPNIEELKAVFGEKGFPAEAEKFFDYYEANGWRVGRNPMKSWQSAVANWIRNGKTYGTLESAKGSLNKTQTKNMEALGEFLKRKGTARPEDIRTGNDAVEYVLPVSEPSA